MSQADYLGVINHSPHQYPFSVNLASLFKWDQGRKRLNKARQTQSDLTMKHSIGKALMLSQRAPKPYQKSDSKVLEAPQSQHGRPGTPKA
ncbi:hypothetical protein AMTR_s00072p00174000 [Amborella trichopoda]|uniref:Uncharacterized protein n=1 Tax=Amborella trichopoda TaxID=13333 RepID=W1NPC9_AMBTC|nr:hypothetical protein AMTR_s00072p00174000 [Amborella trichopoda]